VRAVLAKVEWVGYKLPANVKDTITADDSGAVVHLSLGIVLGWKFRLFPFNSFVEMKGVNK
jgi:hypothetical protein